MVKEIMADELDKMIQEGKEGKGPTIIIVDFSAVWCGPCKSLGRVLESKVLPKLEEMDDVALVKIDIDNNRDLAMDLNVRGVPSMMFWVKGDKVVFDTPRGPEDRIVGFHPKIDEIIFDFIEETKKQM